MKLLRFKHMKFVTPEERSSMAQLIADVLAVGRVEFKPYKPNEGDDTFWTVDSGNDWKVFFFIDKPDIVGIRYRYNAQGRNPHEAAIVPWLMVRLGAIYFADAVDGNPTVPLNLASDEMLKVICSLYNVTPAAVATV